MTIIDWANRELDVLKGQLAYLSSGAARFYDGSEPEAATDRTGDCIAMVERHIEEWKRLMRQNGIVEKRPERDES